MRSGPVIKRAKFSRLNDAHVAALRACASLTPTASDVLDGLGYVLAIPADVIQPRCGIDSKAVGHAVTLRYLPERNTVGERLSRGLASRLGHQFAFEQAQFGDVIVIDSSCSTGVSVCGGMAASAAREFGISGIVIDGGCRDLTEIRSNGLPVSSRSVTPVTGSHRLMAVEVNDVVVCGGIQIHPGDLILADASGVCAIPAEVAQDVARRILEIKGKELPELP